MRGQRTLAPWLYREHRPPATGVFQCGRDTSHYAVCCSTNRNTSMRRYLTTRLPTRNRCGPYFSAAHRFSVLIEILRIFAASIGLRNSLSSSMGLLPCGDSKNTKRPRTEPAPSHRGGPFSAVTFSALLFRAHPLKGIPPQEAIYFAVLGTQGVSRGLLNTLGRSDAMCPKVCPRTPKRSHGSVLERL